MITQNMKWFKTMKNFFRKNKQGLTFVLTLPLLIFLGGVRRLALCAEGISEDLMYTKFLNWFDLSIFPRLFDFIFKSNNPSFGKEFTTWLSLSCGFWLLVFYLL